MLERLKGTLNSVIFKYYFDNKLSFSEHRISIVVQCSTILCVVVGSCQSFSDKGCLVTLFYSLIRSRQRKFSKQYIYNKDFGFYPKRGSDHSFLLSLFNPKSLQHRRTLHSITFLFKIVHNYVNVRRLLLSLNLNFANCIDLFNTRRLKSFASRIRKLTQEFPNTLFLLIVYYYDIHFIYIIEVSCKLLFLCVMYFLL